MNRYINENGTFNHGAWQRDQILNEGPGNDPALKALRTRIPGETFPELTSWWEYEPEDIMTYVYWHQGQLPPTGPKFEREWKNIVKQLHAKYPIPADAELELNEANLDRAGRPIKGFQPGDMWREDFDYIGMLKYGAQATYDLGLETLQALFDSFEDVNYHRESQDLGNAIDWMEDPGQDANRAQEMIEDFLARFRKKCMSTLDVMKVKWTPGK